MHNLKSILLFIFAFCSLSAARATIILVESTADSGPGTLRNSVEVAAEGDTILINRSGDIVLESPLIFDESKENITLIGVYPKHHNITSSSEFSDAIVQINNSEEVKFIGMHFSSNTTDPSRLISITESEDIFFSRCLFERGNTTANGGAINIESSEDIFIRSCSFIGNQAFAGGAVAFDDTENTIISNCTFAQNTAMSTAGAILMSNSEVNLRYSTLLKNNALADSIQAIEIDEDSEIILENCAIGDNGGPGQKQLKFDEGVFISNGGNRVKINDSGDMINELPLPLLIDDFQSVGLILGLRVELLQDGFGLKYYPIVDETSQLINVQPSTSMAPLVDCRNAPRSLSGGFAVNYSDAGACEYTHLRVTNNSSDAMIENSLPWALDPGRLKDTVNYVEFDFTDISDVFIGLTSEITMSDATYFIDGYSQNGSTIPGPPNADLTVLKPADLNIFISDVGGNDFALKFADAAADSRIQGININGFEGYALKFIDLANNSRVFGCEIGINSSGAASANKEGGIYIDSAAFIRIGGPEHWMRNVISGNGDTSSPEEEANIRIKRGQFVSILGNIIGGNKTGNGVISLPDTKTNFGILCERPHNQIGGSRVNERNFIIDNQYGIYFTLTGDTCRVLNNSIGVGIDEDIPLGNTIAGIALAGADKNIIGNSNDDIGNTIANNGTGIAIFEETTVAIDNTIRGNRIYNNINQGIDIDFDSIPLIRDSLAPITGNNHELDAPKIISAAVCDVGSAIKVELSVPTGFGYFVEFFTVGDPDLDGYGEGQQKVSQQMVGSVTESPHIVTFTSGGAPFTEGQNLTATVTQVLSGVFGSTSEFGNNIEITSGVLPEFTLADFCPDEIGPEADIITGAGGEFRFAEPVPSFPVEIEIASGVILNGIEGEVYTVVYEADACTNNDTVMVSVINVPEEFSYDLFCSDVPSDAAIVDITGGVFSFLDPTVLTEGEIINSTNGIITGSVEGIEYEIIHSLTIDGCTQSDTITISPIEINSTFEFDDFCPIAESEAPIAAVSTGTFSFTAPIPDDVEIDSDSGAITGGVEGAIYGVIHTVIDSTGTCTEVDTVMVNVISTDESFNIPDFCADFPSFPATKAEDGGEFSFSLATGDFAEIDMFTGVISMATPSAVYSVQYTVGACDERDTILVTALSSDTADFTIESFCAETPISVDITGTLGGMFSFNPLPGDGATIDVSTGLIIDPVSGTTYSIQYITSGGIDRCSDTLIQSVMVYDSPEILSISTTKTTYCPGDNLFPIMVTDANNIEQIYWREDDQINEILDSNFSFTPSSIEVGENLFYVQAVSDQGCLSSFELITYVLSDTAGMRAIEDFEICLGSAANLDASGGIFYEWSTDVPLADINIPNPVAFSLSEELYEVLIRNSEGCETIDSVFVSFLPKEECDVVVFNAFSPNNDGVNDFWEIEHLINFVPNNVYIYDRWGDIVTDFENYDNINVLWNGTDRGGRPLPPNTYFYVVISEEPEQNQAGWVQLVR